MLPLVAVVVVVAVVGNVGALLVLRDERIDLTNEIRWQLAAAATYVDEPLADGALRPDPTYTPNVSIAGLRQLRDDGLWSPGVTLTPRIVVDGAARYGLRRVGAQRPAVPPVRIVATFDIRSERNGDCITLTPTGPAPRVELAAGAGAFSFDLPSGAIEVRFRSMIDPSVVSGPVDPGSGVGPQWVEVFPVGATAVIDLPSGETTTLCGVLGQ
jgi:hypothetical protein